MTLSILFFFISLVLLALLVWSKAVAVGRGEQNKLLANLSGKFDPRIGSILSVKTKVISKVGGGGPVIFVASIGVTLAHGLFALRNLFAKIAARLYHVSRKAGVKNIKESEAGNPSFFLKAVSGFKREDEQDKTDQI